jgi:hypothetical protein
MQQNLCRRNKKQKEKKQEAVSAAVQVNVFQTTVDPNDDYTLPMQGV